MYPAIDYIRGNLHESISYNNSISLSCMPIYYLEPGWRIYVSDTKSDIDGDFII